MPRSRPCPHYPHLMPEPVRMRLHSHRSRQTSRWDARPQLACRPSLPSTCPRARLTQNSLAVSAERSVRHDRSDRRGGAGDSRARQWLDARRDAIRVTAHWRSFHGRGWHRPGRAGSHVGGHAQRAVGGAGAGELGVDRERRGEGARARRPVVAGAGDADDMGDPVRADRLDRRAGESRWRSRAPAPPRLGGTSQSNSPAPFSARAITPGLRVTEARLRGGRCADHDPRRRRRAPARRLHRQGFRPRHARESWPT